MTPFTVAILAICAALGLFTLLLLVAIFVSKARRESAWEAIKLAVDFARNPWVRCQDCSIHWNTKNGRQTFEAPTEFVVFRTCPDCIARAKKNLGAETITGSNEQKGSEMPAERNGDQLTYRLERHARAHSLSQRSHSTITKVEATPSERSTALANLNQVTIKQHGDCTTYEVKTPLANL